MEILKQTRVVKAQSTEILASTAARISVTSPLRVTVESHGQDSIEGCGLITLMKRGDSHLVLLVHYLGLNLGEVLPAIALQRPFSVWGSTGFPQMQSLWSV